MEGSFLIFLIFYIIYSLLRYKKSHGALAMAKTKPKIQNVLTKETSGTKISSDGVRTGPRPTYRHEIKTSCSKETLLQPADSMKNTYVNLAFLGRHKVTKGNYIRRAGRNRGKWGRRARKHARGKTVAVDMIKRARAPRRVAEDQTGASGPMSRTP